MPSRDSSGTQAFCLYPVPFSSSGVNLLVSTHIFSEGAFLARPCPDGLSLMSSILDASKERFVAGI